jgi:uncharacterized spore protein YtfJ
LFTRFRSRAARNSSEYATISVSYREEFRMDIQEAIAKAQDTITVKRVYGEPYERDGVVLIPAAEVRGGGGGGGGTDAASESSGGGGGFGVDARPVGAYVIEGGSVRWEPAVDVGRIAVRAMITALGLAFLLRRTR